MAESKLVLGPTFEEMLHPWQMAPAIRARAQQMRAVDPLDPINLYNITWRGPDDQIYYEVLPPQLTGVEAPIVVLYGKEFPTGSHKVGAAYSVLIEKELTGEVDPTHPPPGVAQHRQLWHRRGVGWLPDEL